MSEAENRVISPADRPDDIEQEANLRPRTLEEYVGQPAMREKLSIFLAAAKKRSEALDHVNAITPQE